MQLKNNDSRNVIYEVEGVVMRPLPFYDVTEVLINPAGLMSDGVAKQSHESLVEFRLTPEQANLLAMAAGEIQVIARFCILDTSTEQDDNFPPEIMLKVNGMQIQLPPAIANPNKPLLPPKRQGQHVDITKFCKFSPLVANMVLLTWLADPTDLKKSFAITIMIAEKRDANTLLERITSRGALEMTKNLIVDSDNEISTTNLQTSLVCPLGKMKITWPCKSVRCQHIPCFDALSYLQMNEKKPTWICPVCNKPAYFQDLRIDEYFVDVLTNTNSSVTEITLEADGSWKPVVKVEQPVSATNSNQPEIICISDDDD